MAGGLSLVREALPPMCLGRNQRVSMGLISFERRVSENTGLRTVGCNTINLGIAVVNYPNGGSPAKSVLTVLLGLGFSRFSVVPTSLTWRF
jgi:hypothetical protein